MAKLLEYKIHPKMSVEMEDKQEISRSRREKIIEETIPYMLCIFANICLGGFNIVSKVSLDKGISRYVLVVYGNVLGTLASAPLAFILERKNKSQLSRAVVLYIFLLGLLGSVLGRTLYFVGLEYTSPTFTSAMGNLIPSLTFVLAVACRMEKLDISKQSSRAKMAGTAVAFAGAVLMTVYKGLKLISSGSLAHLKVYHQTNSSNLITLDQHWIKGSLMLIISYISLAAFYILQGKTIKMYPAPITLTSLTCLSGALLSTIMAVILDHKPESWRLSWDISLLAPLYNGVVVFAIVNYVQTLVTRTRGPVFMTAFRPLATLIVAIIGLFFGEALYLGSVVGALMIIVGLYTILWGKEKENVKKHLELTSNEQDIEMR